MRRRSTKARPTSCLCGRRSRRREEHPAVGGNSSRSLTRTKRPRAAAPTLIAVNGGDPAMPTSFRPMFETSTIRLVFSEPLDPRTVTNVTGSVELIDMTTRIAVPATVIASGIHVVIDPKSDLTAGPRTSCASATGSPTSVVSCSRRG